MSHCATLGRRRSRPAAARQYEARLEAGEVAVRGAVTVKAGARPEVAAVAGSVAEVAAATVARVESVGYECGPGPTAAAEYEEPASGLEAEARGLVAARGSVMIATGSPAVVTG